MMAASRKVTVAAPSVSISPASQSKLFTTLDTGEVTKNFSSESVSVSGGTPTSYNWYLESTSGGTWAIGSGQGTAVAIARVTDWADSVGSATLKCDVVVDGVTYTVSASLSYTLTYIG